MVSCERWMWKMDFCKQMGWNPAFDFYWEKAEEVYNESVQTT